MLSPRASSARRSSRLLRMASTPTSRAGSTMSEKPSRSLRWKVTAQTYPPLALLDGTRAAPHVGPPPHPSPNPQHRQPGGQMRTHIVGRFRANALLLVATTFAVACTDSQSPTPQSPAVWNRPPPRPP